MKRYTFITFWGQDLCFFIWNWYPSGHLIVIQREFIHLEFLGCGSRDRHWGVCWGSIWICLHLVWQNARWLGRRVCLLSNDIQSSTRWLRSQMLYRGFSLFEILSVTLCTVIPECCQVRLGFNCHVSNKTDCNYFFFQVLPQAVIPGNNTWMECLRVFSVTTSAAGSWELSSLNCSITTTIIIPSFSIQVWII